MTNPYLCILYIDTDEKSDDIENIVHSVAREVFGNLPVLESTHRNDGFKAPLSANDSYDFTERSRYYSEVDVDEDEKYLPAFRSGVVAMVKKLREGRRFVTAVCDFSDLVARETGWNWTDEHPEPPGRKTREK